MIPPGFFVYKVHTPEGERNYVTLLPPERVQAKGLPAEAIVGLLAREPAKGEPITPGVFEQNPAFVRLLHTVIAENGPAESGLQAAARRRGEWCVSVIDGRTPDPAGRVPPEDILGSFEVRKGIVAPESYQPNAKHRILSDRGFFRLDRSLHQRLLESLQKL
ncbi:MAG TPA: hypothetical protein VKG01_21330 [Thermoanaerobaculia bacterium]|nr:hypothetical protein [Thermoanaerobaculia bacterium]